MVKIRNLTFGYSEKKVLKNISIDFVPDKVNVIIGQNGAGKTTLFDLISGIYSKVDGMIDGPPDKDVVYQLQGVPFLNTLRGKDIVKLFMNTDHRRKKSKVTIDSFCSLSLREEELIKKLWDTPFGKMSLGERRWLIVSLICQMNRKVYIFDEPTSGVDPDSRTKILYRIQDLSKRKDTLVIASTHILHELEYVDCQLYLLHEGNISFKGSYNDFLKRSGTTNPDNAFKIFTQTI